MGAVEVSAGTAESSEEGLVGVIEGLHLGPTDDQSGEPESTESLRD